MRPAECGIFIGQTGFARRLKAPRKRILERTLAFHHCMRTFLHFQAKRNFNVLSYEHQEQIAPRLGYSESPHGEAAETMMRDYFLQASQIARRASMWEEEVGRSRSKIAIQSDFSDPFDMIEAFAEAHRKKASLHAVTLSAIRQRLNGFRRHPREQSAGGARHPRDDEGPRRHLRHAAGDA